MSWRFKQLTVIAAGLSGLVHAESASASLTLFQSYVGSYGLSTDGGGSTGSSYAVSAFVPLGATVAAAYLYQSNVPSAGAAQPVSLNGNSLTFNGFSTNPGNGLTSARADVTSIVSTVVNGGLGGTYNFTVGEGASSVTDGTGLVVVYSLASLPTTTVALLDGFSASGGDNTALNFADPLDPSAPGFSAEMRLGIGFSCCGQASTVRVNGTTITMVAGNDDDGISGDSNGALITVGGNDDPFSTLLPTYADDHERYNLASYITNGSTSIAINTNNPSGDDNIFLAAFSVVGRAGVNAPPPPATSDVPEPATWAMMICGFGGIGAALRRRSRTPILA